MNKPTEEIQYCVTIHTTNTYLVEVKANSAKEAEKKAIVLYDKNPSDHYSDSDSEIKVDEL